MFTPITLTGRVTADLELQTNQNNTEYVQFNMAVNKGYGEQEHPNFYQCVLFGKADAEKPTEAEAVTEPASPAKPAPDNRETETMLLHIALRITEKLKSAYPQSVWQWKDTPSLQDILAGGTVRILVENMDAYTHAGISFDRFGRIHVELMTIGTFAEPSAGSTNHSEETPPEPSVVDTFRTTI